MPDSSEYQKLRTVKESYAAQLARKTFEGRGKTLAVVSEVDARQFDRERELAKKILSMPEQMAPNLAADDNARNCEEIIEAAVRAALSYGGT